MFTTVLSTIFLYLVFMNFIYYEIFLFAGIEKENFISAVSTIVQILVVLGAFYFFVFAHKKKSPMFLGMFLIFASLLEKFLLNSREEFFAIAAEKSNNILTASLYSIPLCTQH